MPVVREVAGAKCAGRSGGRVDRLSGRSRARGGRCLMALEGAGGARYGKALVSMRRQAGFSVVRAGVVWATDDDARRPGTVRWCL